MKPTEEQIKEFWEWCGFEKAEQENMRYYYGEGENRRWGYSLPTIDLNNLFNYAVPKAECDVEMWRWWDNDLHVGEYIWCVYVHIDNEKHSDMSYQGKDKDVAFALFWALWEAKKEE